MTPKCTLCKEEKIIFTQAQFLSGDIVTTYRLCYDCLCSLVREHQERIHESIHKAKGKGE